MATNSNRSWSDLPIPPGEILLEELQARNMTQKELALRLGRPSQVINEIIKGKKAITSDTALGLESVLGIEAQYWANLERDYQMVLARIRAQQKLAAEVAYLDSYPVKEMIKRGWMEAGREKPSKLKALQVFFGMAVAEPLAIQEAVGFRLSKAALQRISLGALAVWLRQGELEAQQLQTTEYDEEAFRQALMSIRQLTVQPYAEFIPIISDLCAESGVVFCMVQELPKSGAVGAMRWMKDGRPMIQMSLRHKWADIFWFTFFHEACHVLQRKQHRFVVDFQVPDPDLTEFEEEANNFARDLLIPPEAWAGFCEEVWFSEETVQEFSKFVGIAPFIVVGRLQKEGKIRYGELVHMKEQCAWPETNRKIGTSV